MDVEELRRVLRSSSSTREPASSTSPFGFYVASYLIVDRLPLFEPAPAKQREVLSVTQLTAQIKQVLEQALPLVWVSGEVSDVGRPQSGHIYFTLKDKHAQIRGVIWRTTAQRMKFHLEDGQQVVCLASIDVYPPRGGYQIVVRQLEPLGLGAQQLALRQLHERLAREGLFDPANKRPLPAFPRRVAVVTSPTGAAIRDFLEVMRRRWQGTRVLVVPARVQGNTAAREVVSGLAALRRLQTTPDVIVIARGGGSIDDLHCFNDEGLVRAIRAAPAPVVAAIGHEIDVTLADLAADLRALTPTEAAERIVPARDEVLRAIAGWEHRLVQRLRWRLADARARVHRLAERPALKRPIDLVRQRQRQVDELELRLRHSMRRHREAMRQRLDALAGKLESLSPLAVLRRGYSVTRTEDGRILRDAGTVQPGERLTTRVAQGMIYSRVESAEPAPDSPATES